MGFRPDETIEGVRANQDICQTGNDGDRILRGELMGQKTGVHDDEDAGLRCHHTCPALVLVEMLADDAPGDGSVNIDDGS